MKAPEIPRIKNSPLEINEYIKFRHRYRVTYPRAAKTALNRLKKYSLTSIINSCIAVLSQTKENKIDELKSAPWLTILTLKYCLEDKAIGNHGNRCSIADINLARQYLWENTSYIEATKGQASLHLGMRALMDLQLRFQIKHDYGFIRLTTLITNEGPSHPLWHLFQKKIGIPPDIFQHISIMTFSINEGYGPITGEHLKIFNDTEDRWAEKYINLLSHDITSLREDAINLRDKRVTKNRERRNPTSIEEAIRPKTELVEFPWLWRKPLLRNNHSQYFIWHRDILAYAIEELPHHLLSEEGQAYTDPFSKLFERYVVSLCEECDLQLITDREYKTLINDQSAPAVDAIITSEAENIFIEAKMAIFSDDLIATDNPNTLFIKIKRIRKAIKQAINVKRKLITSSAIPTFDNSKPIFLIVVVSRPIQLCSGIQLKYMIWDDIYEDIYPEDKFGPITTDEQKIFPAENIILCSISEYERVIAGIKTGIFTLSALVKKAAAFATSPATATLNFGQVIGSMGKYPVKTSLLEKSVESSFDAMTKRVA